MKKVLFPYHKFAQVFYEDIQTFKDDQSKTIHETDFYYEHLLKAQIKKKLT